MIDCKVGFGPMSKEIIDIIFDYSIEKNKKIMIIASRNQIDTEKIGGGYVFSTEKFFEYIKNKNRKNVLICRDHCGPFFNVSEKVMNFNDAVVNTKKTIEEDINNGFDLIHIDTSLCGGREYTCAEDLFKFSLNINPNILFEFGTEENVGKSVGENKYIEDVKFASHFSDHIEFVVGQTGSYVFEDKQYGIFDNISTKKLVDAANKYNVKFKEHNADYLFVDQIRSRKNTGVHAVNIAPEFGVIQTRLLKEMSNNNEYKEFYNYVINSNKWKKWVNECSNDLKFLVAGHYCFNSDEYKKLIDTIDYELFKKTLKEYLYIRFDDYINNI